MRATRCAAPAGRGWLAISAAAVCWGTGGAAAAILFQTSGLGPVAVTFWRFAIAAAALVLVRLAQRQNSPLPHGEPRSGRAVVITGCCLAVSQATYFGAVDAAGVSLGTLVAVGASPVLTAVGSRCFLGEPLTARGLAAIGIASGGLTLLVVGSHQAPAGSSPLLGAALALVCAVAYSAVTLLGRSGRGGGASLGAFTAGAVCLAPAAGWLGLWTPEASTVSAVGWLLLLGVVNTLIAYRWYFTGLATVPAATAAVIVLLEPVAATGIGVIALGERLTGPAAVGGGLLLAALIVLARASKG
ncbi:DMT family transporter [Goodfellowiella coeruleoviolacea]|uniref:Drug/metabolite transporter, DME family n=1 Tax=Goodfellowiella coeruleoviolacea TaxID=334858 RepID=A0AAE3KI20_9PSEU|nr:EamA family transporter [Goodfellowiella coeruleoviolacea]MCP2167497.1 drug/metabolite transporter, DME family [Goodfellowiella coeruleoviolacea]